MRRIILEWAKRGGSGFHHLGRFALSAFHVFTPFPKIWQWITRHVAVFVAMLTAAFTIASALTVWHYASAATQGRGSIVTNGLAGIGTLLAAGIALFVALLAQERDEMKEHRRVRPILSVYATWTPPLDQNGQLEVMLEIEWGDPGYGYIVLLRPSHLPPEAYFPMLPEAQNPILLSPGKPWLFTSQRTGFADETGYYIYVRYMDILGWEWGTEDGIWLSDIGNTRKMAIGPYATAIPPNQPTVVSMPIPQHVTKELPPMWGPESYDRVKTPSIRRQIANVWFNARPRPPRVAVTPPNYSPSGYTSSPNAGSPPRGRSAYWNPRPANRYRRR